MRNPVLATLFLLAGLSLLLPSQAFSSQEPATDSAEEGSDPAAELADAKQELKLAELHLQGLLQEQDLNRLQAEFELQNSMVALETYNRHGKQAGLDQAILDLQYQRDSLADAEEELRQLGMMYDSNNLADQTAQIVMQRATRDVERQRTALALAEAEHKEWVEFGMAQEARELQQAMRLAQAEKDSLAIQQQIDRTEAEMEIADLKKRIGELKQALQEQRD